MTSRCARIAAIALLLFCVGAMHSSPAAAALPTIEITTPLTPPTWALLERQVIDTSAAACEEFYARYFDERGYFECVERWGGDDGADDAIENCNDWPLLYVLGGPEKIRTLYEKAWEGHLRQYTAAKTKDVPFAREGMYYKEFPVMFDWLHNGEGLAMFNQMPFASPTESRLGDRVRRYAGFYMNEDAGAPNYDPQHKIVRSMFNGSRGPLLRKATAVDWAGDPIDIENRFSPRHGERSYAEMLAHFKDYTDIVGDLPQNLRTTNLALNAYALTGESKYQDWLLEYVNAWKRRAAENGNILPSNVGLDGKIGSSAGGKWYGGVYGWGFSVKVPQTGELAHRNLHAAGFAGLAADGAGASGLSLGLTGDGRALRPRRCALPITALRDTPPSSSAIWLAVAPPSHILVSVAIRSSVQLIRIPSSVGGRSRTKCCQHEVGPIVAPHGRSSPRRAGQLHPAGRRPQL